ncbi:Mitochondrial/choloroplast ribosomal protein S15 [Handroanthus impetiginosus]|uniref:Small ribosomal subunit protein uS15c n=1 Tax=Handroanthus impetiginosus TaxID=429701 RepID=A0A2G9G589_9LAMI|nr:Mitochondrial/choloroplast ribosomal protein S15 [Handroanthus impetiginosus]
MTVVTGRLLHLRPALRPHTYPLHHFSSSSEAGPPSDVPQPQSESQPSFSSCFTEVKATLQKEPPPHNRPHPPRKPFATPPRAPPRPKLPSLEDIRRNISGFRIPSASSPPSSGSSKYVSLQELYKRNVIGKADASATSSNSSAVKPPIGPSFDAIRDGIRQLRVNSPPAENENDSRWKNDPVSPTRFKESLKLKPDQNPESPLITGGSDRLPSFLEKEKSGSKNDNAGSIAAMRTAFLKMYDYSDLGTKLKMLRPEKKKGKWFSLQELNERLAKLRVVEEKESQERMGGISFKDLRETLIQLSLSEDDETKKKKMQRLNILSRLGETPRYMLSPPKDHLVEKYFHPDNMSAAEKLKLELMKVRDEFKMSESDCGSARVQVAQLTTKIKYLSTVLQKKDKHSRKGLQAMVQRRKKLLKYLRRTDWDSYCLVLSKLGLRDSPDIKA